MIIPATSPTRLKITPFHLLYQYCAHFFVKSKKIEEIFYQSTASSLRHLGDYQKGDVDDAWGETVKPEIGALIKK